MTEWLKDDRGNKCSVEYFGTTESAQKALDSLENCDNCDNCINCSRCSRCSVCSGCSDCSGCSGCSRCSRCSGCSGCSGCSDCSGCSGCSRCSGCSGCSDCSGCSGCSRCSHIANLYDRIGLQADPTKGASGPPPVPMIENVHQTVFAAASNPNALNMSNWHSCDNTHCWAGWVVTLAGDAGKQLEAFFDTPLAAMKILDASSPLKVSPALFFETNEDALRHMQDLAARESAT
jgi:hypothetical protein